MFHVIPLNAVQATPTTSQPMAYRAEFNVMSGRWMVLDANDVCQRAGLSEHTAKTVVNELTQQAMY